MNTDEKRNPVNVTRLGYDVDGVVNGVMTTGTKIENATVIYFMDINCDGSVTSKDMSDVSQYISGQESVIDSMTKIQIYAMDVESNGIINSGDLEVISQSLAGFSGVYQNSTVKKINK